MRIRDLNHTIAASTGESVARINRLGFQLNEPGREIDQLEEHAPPQLVDWDELESERYQRTYWGRSNATDAA